MIERWFVIMRRLEVRKFSGIEQVVQKKANAGGSSTAMSSAKRAKRDHNPQNPRLRFVFMGSPTPPRMRPTLALILPKHGAGREAEPVLSGWFSWPGVHQDVLPRTTQVLLRIPGRIQSDGHCSFRGYIGVRLGKNMETTVMGYIWFTA